MLISARYRKAEKDWSLVSEPILVSWIRTALTFTSCTISTLVSSSSPVRMPSTFHFTMLTVLNLRRFLTIKSPDSLMLHPGFGAGEHDGQSRYPDSTQRRTSARVRSED